MQRDLVAVLGEAWFAAQRLILRLLACAQPHALDIGRLDIGLRGADSFAGDAIDDDRVAGFHEARSILDFADRRDAERTRHDRDMGGRPAFLQHQAAQFLAVIIEQGRRTHHARDQDGIVRQLILLRRMFDAHQLPHQPVGKIVEIVQPLAQVRVGRPHHARAGVGLNPLDAGFGGEAGCGSPRRMRCIQPRSCANMR